MKKTALFITALFGASLANAHNVWLEPVKDAKGQYVVKFGHEDRNLSSKQIKSSTPT